MSMALQVGVVVKRKENGAGPDGRNWGNFGGVKEKKGNCWYGRASLHYLVVPLESHSLAFIIGARHW